MCSLGLHKSLLTSSSDLKDAVNSFVSFTKSLQTQRLEVLPMLMQRDAPRILGDIFAAVAAAIFVDSNWSTFVKSFEQVIDDHLLSLVKEPYEAEPFKLKAWMAPVEAAMSLVPSFAVRECSRQIAAIDVLKLAFDASTRRCFGHGSLPPAPPPESEVVEAELGCEKQCKAALELKDFHVFQAYDGDTELGALVMATSPRSAKRRCAWQAYQQLGGFKDHYDERYRIACEATEGKIECGDVPFDASALVQADATSIDTSGQAIYCKDCDMWLNGPKQWKDHKIGKKHKKNIMKQKPEPQEKKTA